MEIVGDNAKLINQLFSLFPGDINLFFIIYTVANPTRVGHHVFKREFSSCKKNRAIQALADISKVPR